MTPTRSTGRLPELRFDRHRLHRIVFGGQRSESHTRIRERSEQHRRQRRPVPLEQRVPDVRGGYFYDNYKDTGVPLITSYTYQAPNFNVPGVPPSLQGPVNTVNTPRILLSNFDKTTQGFFQLDYNHAFTGLGSHLIKGGWGVRRSVNDVDVSYPGGYVDRTGASRSAARQPAKPSSR